MLKYLQTSACITLVTLLSNQAFAAGGLFLNTNDNQAWSEDANWENGVPELDGSLIAIYHDPAGGMGPIIADGDNAEGGAILLGHHLSTTPIGTPITLTMTGGTLDVWTDLWIGWEGLNIPEEDGPGIFNISGGTVTMFEHPGELHNHIVVGKGSNGTVNQTGGEIFTQAVVLDFWGVITPDNNGPDGGVYNLHGGTLDIVRPSDEGPCGGPCPPIFFGPESLMDITEGVMTLGDDWTGTVQAAIDVGKLTAYGGEGQVMYDFDVTTPGKVTVWAEPGSDCLDGVACARSDINMNGTVDFADFVVLSTDFGKTSTHAPGGVANIPEPTGIALLVIGGLALLFRRRQ